MKRSTGNFVLDSTTSSKIACLCTAMSQLIWVVPLSFTFIAAILTTPILLSSNFQNADSANISGNLQTCPEEFAGYCMNGGFCFYLEKQQTVACKCPELYGRKCSENIYHNYVKKKKNTEFSHAFLK